MFSIGEAINGPGGYFGWNLDALHDCLRGGFGALTPGYLFAHEFLRRTSARADVRMSGGMVVGQDDPYVVHTGAATTGPLRQPRQA